MKAFDTYLFDLDGTLTASAPGILNAVRYALKTADAPIPDARTLNRFIGPPLVDSFMVHCGMTHERALKALADYRVYYAERGMFENSVYDGIPALLETLNARGATCVVATAKPEVYARKITDRFGLTPHFAAVFGATLDESRNCKEAVVAWALAHSGATESAVMVGDRAQDVEGAHANRIPCIAALWGYGDREELSAAEFFAASPSDILRASATSARE